MAPFSQSRPNPMIPVGGPCVIDHALHLLREAGVNTVTVVTGHKGDVLRRHLTGEHASGVNISFVEQGKGQGIGGAILAARERFSPGENFLLVYADTLTTANIFSVTLQAFGLHGDPTAAICLTESGEKYGNVYLGQEMKITKIVEKPRREKGLGNYVLAGVFALNTAFFELLGKAKGDMEAAWRKLIENGSLRAAIWEDRWLDLAYPWDVLTANRMVMEQWKAAVIHESVTLSGASVKGPVIISKGADIRPGTVLEGPAFIGENCFIGHNTLVRPYTCVGARSVIGHGVELKNCVMFPNTTVGRLSFIGDSVVGEGVDIGAGTMTINRTMDQRPVTVKVNGKPTPSGLTKLGAFIGDGAVIGASNILAAGAIVPEGARIGHNLSYPPQKRGGR